MALRAMSMACARGSSLVCWRTVGRCAGPTLLFTGAGLHACASFRQHSKIILCESARAADPHCAAGSSNLGAAVPDESAGRLTPGDMEHIDCRASIQVGESDGNNHPTDQGAISDESADESAVFASAQDAPAVAASAATTRGVESCQPEQKVEPEKSAGFQHEQDHKSDPPIVASVQTKASPARRLNFGQLLQRLIEILGWNCCFIAAGAMASMLKVGMSLLNSSNFGAVMNALDDEAALRLALTRLMGIELAKAALDFLLGLLLDAGLDALTEKLKFALFRSLLHQDAAFFDAHVPTELTSKFSEVGQIRSFVKTLSTGTLETVTAIAGNIVELIRKSPDMCKKIVLSLIPGFSVFGVLLSFIRTSDEAVDDANVKVNSTVLESLVNIRTVQSFAAEEQELDKYADKREKYWSAKSRLRFWKQTLSLTGTLWFNSVQGLILFTASGLVRAGSISKGEVSSLFLHLFALMGACGKLLGLLQAISTGTVATRSILKTLDQQPSVRCEAAEPEPSESLRGALDFHSVHFRYPTRPDEEVLRDVSLSIAPGSHVALVGASGSGKSTLGWLAQRFYDCNQGAVHVDGKDVRQLSPQWLKRHIAYVEQEPALFSGTIRQNIQYGRRGASQAEVAAAADAALVSEFAQTLPGGLDTEVGDSGAMLSGGQKQRVAIARALLKDPRILILDEATSALDSGTEQSVQKALRRTMAGRTKLVIAHRLSTVRGADRIVVLDRGAVAEVGTHQELLSINGLYSKFVRQQENRAADSV